MKNLEDFKELTAKEDGYNSFDEISDHLQPEYIQRANDNYREYIAIMFAEYCVVSGYRFHPLLRRWNKNQNFDHMGLTTIELYAQLVGSAPTQIAQTDLLHIPDVSVSLPVEKVNEARYAYAADYPSELRAGIEEAHLQGQMFVMKQLGLEIGYGNER